MTNDKDIQLYDVRGLVPYDIKEQIELDALKMQTSQKTIVGIAISQHYADRLEISSANLRQKYSNLCKKTQIFQENIEFLQKNNGFELKITQILSIFKYNLSSSSYESVRELFFKEMIDLITEYKALYPDRIKKVDQIVKRFVNKELFKFYLDEFVTVKKSGPLKHPYKDIVYSQSGQHQDDDNIQKIQIDDIDLEDHPMNVISDLLNSFEIKPKALWAESVENCKTYLHKKYINELDVDTTISIFDEQQKRMYDTKFGGLQ